MKVKAPFRIFGPLDEHTRENLERWLRRGPQYDAISYAGRDVLLLWEGELVSKIVGPFGEQAHGIAEVARQYMVKPFGGVDLPEAMYDEPEVEPEPERRAAIGRETHRPKFLR